jgi:DNA invertase Pin-like site-specific DNA recombinase
MMRAAAIYARVSTPRQGREQTIESQLALLKSWADENAYELSPENVYTDEGYSGSRLDRPGLDALRDGAEDGAFEIIGVLSPDRLARKYANPRCYCSKSWDARAVRLCSSITPSLMTQTTSSCCKYREL